MEKGTEGILARYLGAEAAAQTCACPEPARLGAVRQACVLFADMRHFSRLAEQMELLALRRFLGDFMQLFVDSVEARGGMVNKFVGDGALAGFQRPGPAALAALRLHEDFLQLRSRWQAASSAGCRAAFAALDLAVGLSCGAIFLGNVGGGGRYDFTALGVPVNVAQRLAAEAPEGGVYCTAAVRAEVDAAIVAEALGAVQPRGMSARITVFRLRQG